MLLTVEKKSQEKSTENDFLFDFKRIIDNKDHLIPR